jgi:hypothetical protein
MMKRARPGSVRADFLSQLAGYLHAAREAGRCDTPVPRRELDRLVDGSANPDARRRAWQHLAWCVFCLNAYAELRGAALSLQELGVAPAPVAPVVTEATLPVVAPGREEKARRAFQMRVKKFTMELQGVLRTWQHRAVQRHWSDPAEGIDWQLDLAASPRSVPSLAESPGPDVLEALERAERRAEEQLEEIRTVKRLVATSQDLLADIRDAGLAVDVRSELISALESQRARILGLLRRASWRAGRK